MSHHDAVPLGETSSRTESTPSGGTTTADRVADVLFAFISGPASLGVSGVAREVGISKAVVYRIFQSLLSRKFLQVDAGTRSYRLGPSAAALGARALRDLDMRRAAQPILQALRDKTDETTTLTELVGDSRVYLDQFESRQSIRMTVELGRPHALHAGGSGKSIMAFLPRHEQDRLLRRQLEKITPATITDRAKLLTELREIAHFGYAISLGERQHDAGSVASPIFGSDGTVIGALSVCGPVGRFDGLTVASHAKQVMKAAAEVSRRMGWSGPYPVAPIDDPQENGAR
ncbi:MAG: IclR family transcriptional regulator [Nakamurella sp.]